MNLRKFLTNVAWSFIPIYVGQFVGFLISFAGYSLFPLFIHSDTGRYAACAIVTVIACIAAAFFLCRMRGEAHEQFPGYDPMQDFAAYAVAEVIYVGIMLLTGGRTFSTINAIYACMAILGKDGTTTNEAIRTGHAGLLALVIVCMNVVTLPAALFGFITGKKKREKERASIHGNQ